MDSALSHRIEREESTKKTPLQLKLCLPLLKPKGSSNTSNPFSQLALWVEKSLRNLCCKAKDSNGFCFRRLQFNGMVVNNSVYCASPGLVENSEEMSEKRHGFGVNWHGIEGFGDGGRENSSSGSDNLVSETTVNEEQSSSVDSSPSMGWPVKKTEVPQCASSNVSQQLEKTHLDDRKLQKQGSTISGINCFIFVLLYHL